MRRWRRRQSAECSSGASAKRVRSPAEGPRGRRRRSSAMLPYSVILRWPRSGPRRMNGRGAEAIALRGSLRSHLRVTEHWQVSPLLEQFVEPLLPFVLFVGRQQHGDDFLLADSGDDAGRIGFDVGAGRDAAEFCQEGLSLLAEQKTRRQQ